MSYDESSSRKSRVMMGESPIRGSEKAKRPSDLPAGKVVDASGQGEAPCAVDWPTLSDGRPDFKTMTSQQRRAYDQDRLKRIFG